jgi:hypothetical protein
MMGKKIFNKDPIFPQSSKKEPAAYSKSAELTPESAELTSPVPVALADPQSAKMTLESASRLSQARVPLGYL